MSFELYIERYVGGEGVGFARQLVREAFGAHLNEAEPNFWQLNYDATNSCDVYLQSDPSDPHLTVGVMVHRPCGDLRLWQSLFSLLQRGELILHFPGASVALAARPVSPSEFPPDFFTAEPPRLVGGGEEFRQAIESS